MSTLWYWQTNKKNNVIDSDNAKSIQRVTRKINGGSTGVDESVKLFNEVSKLQLV